MATKKRRRRRKKRYHTGTYVSSKTNVVSRYRSSWELQYMQYLDDCSEVVSWSYECVKVPYLSNQRTGKMRTYFPDFLVEYVDKRVELVEVKPSKRLTQARVQKKLEAARGYCNAHGLTLVVLTEKELKGLGLLKRK